MFVDDNKVSIVITCDFSDGVDIFKTLNDLANQTHWNFEVLCLYQNVNNCQKEIIDFIEKNKRRFKLIETNTIEIKSILVGMKLITGKYVVISKPGIRYSTDYLRKALQTIDQADMVMSCPGISNNDDYYCYPLNPLHHLESVDLEWILNKSVLFTPIMSLYNKLVSIDLLRKTIHFFKKLSETEDYINFEEDLIAVTWMLQSKAIKVLEREYLYEKVKVKELKPGLSGLRNIIMHVSGSLSKEICIKNFGYYCLMKQFNRNNLKIEICNWLNKETKIDVNVEDYNKFCTEKYYYNVSYNVTQTYKKEETLKKYIGSRKCKCVSFDLFDTLVTRSFGKPEDLFGKLNDTYKKETGQNNRFTDFGNMRLNAQKKAYHDFKRSIGKKEDLDLSGIYDCLGTVYNVPKNALNILQKEEEELEINCSNPRKTTIDYIELAKYVKKKVIITSDTYFSREIIQKILDKNKINVDALYLSSEIKLKKDTGSLFDYVLSNENIEDPKELCHIGDNKYSDYTVPKKKNIEAFHISKTWDMIMNEGDHYSGECFKNIFKLTNPLFIEYTALDSYADLRRILQIIANKIFDNPFKFFNNKSDFNTDWEMIGYGLIGPQLLAYISWLNQNDSLSKHTVHFVSRDGWLIKQAYDLIAKIVNLNKSNYLQISRKSLMCADINNENDLFMIVDKVNVPGMTVGDLINELSPMINHDAFEKIIKYYKKKNLLNKKMQNETNFIEFMRGFLEKYAPELSYDKELYKEYFRNIVKKNDVIFDIGYSGRPEAALSLLLNYPINGFYVHSKTDILNQRSQQVGFKTKTFFDYRPSITGVVRENIMMEAAGSTIGYTRIDNKILPIIEDYDEEKEYVYITKLIQSSALEFIKDCLTIFGERILELQCRNYDLALPSEYFYSLSKDADKYIYNNLMFDDPYGMGNSVSAIDFWNDRQTTLYAALFKPQVENYKTNILLPDKNATKNKRILLYSNEISWSGAPRSLLRIGKCLRNNNYDVEYWGELDKKDGFKKEIESYGINVTVVQQNEIRLNKTDFDLCIVNTILAYGAYETISNVIPTIWYIREAKNIEDTFIKNQSIRNVLESATNIYCVSEYARDFIKPYNKDVTVLHNCVEDTVENYQYIKSDTDTVRFLSLGTVEPRKGFDVIVDAIEILDPKIAEKIEFSFAGRQIKLKSAPTYYTDLMNKIQNMGNVHYLGVLTDETELDSAYNDCDVVLIPSRDESCSLVALEALMHGKPIVVSENVGAKYLVSSKNGLIAQTANPQSWAKAIKKLANKELVEKMSIGARNTYETKLSMKDYEKNILTMVETHIESSINKINTKIINVEIPEVENNLKIVPVVLSSSAYYLKYTMVTIQSLLDNGSRGSFFDIFILTTDISERQMNNIETQNEFYRITCLDISNVISEDIVLFTNQNHVTKETYNRLYAAQLLEKLYEKIIFIDSDTIVCADITHLYNTELEKTIAGAPNFMNPGVYEYVTKDLGLNPYNYINCGVLVIDTKKFIEKGIKSKCIEYIANGNNIRMMDQDAINTICVDEIQLIEPNWNVQWHNHCRGTELVFNQNVYEEAIANPKIIHYTDKIKAWNSPQYELADQFWKYAIETKYFDQILLDNIGINSNNINVKHSENDNNKSIRSKLKKMLKRN